MKKYFLIVTAFIFILPNGCADEAVVEITGQTSFKPGDVAAFAATIKLINENTCSQGFNNFRLYKEDFSIPFCVIAGPDDDSPVCLPDAFKKDGLRVWVKAELLPIPPNVRMNCAPVKLLNIQKI